MDFSFTSEQQQLRDSLQRYLDREYSLAARRQRIASAEGYSEQTWRTFAELGVLALPLPSDVGGFGGDGVDTMIVMECFGRGLVVEPYLATVVQCGGLIELCGSKAQQTSLLPGVAGGETVMAFAHGEALARHDWRYVATQARRSGEGFELSGSKSVVLHAGQADLLIVSARSHGAPSDVEGVSLFLVDAKARGVKLRDYATIDGLRAAEVEFDHVALPGDALLGEVGKAAAAIEAVIDRANAALCAEALGAMAVLHDTTLAYLKTRQQFGVPIGRFQVLQHRMVDVFIHLEQARSLTYYAAFHAHAADAALRRRAVSAAKVQVGEAARYVAQQSIQLHGGMGMTDELNVGHYVKRLTMIGATFGNVDTHLARFAASA